MGLIWDEFKGVIGSILPIVVLVLILQIFVIGSDMSDVLLFSFCAILVLIGFTLFLVGVNVGVIPMGDSIGAEIPRRGSILFMVGVIFTIGFLVILAEPNVNVFTDMIKGIFPDIDTQVMVYAIAIGVAVFLLIATLKTIFGLSLKVILTVTYAGVLILALMSTPEFLGIAFDSGGVITGPLTVPILLALGLGISSAMASRSEMDGFGMIGLASAGPIIAVLVMGLFTGEASTAVTSAPPEVLSIGERLVSEFVNAVYSVVIALTPLVIFFIIFQRVFLKYSWQAVRNMLIGVSFAGVGIIIFFTGVYAGFMPIARDLGLYLSGVEPIWVILLGLLLGFLVVIAEPAVKILGSQVEDASHGVIRGGMIILVLAVGVACMMGIGMAKVMLDIEFIYIIVPGYIVALALMWLSDRDMVGIAFDASGVATGPMVVTVMMTMYVGIADAIYGPEAAAYGFGIVALVALAPLIALSALGVLIKVYKRRSAELE